ncbi:MAG: serine/threonine-protein kinase [Deltaproteobacteria bacterium]
MAEPRQVPPGTMLDDKYRVEELLAVGGMGAVYVGTHTKLRKRVAIKVLNPQLSTPPMIERFHREAITASQIGHEGIAQVTDLGTSAAGEPFLVMELLEGESLAARLKATGALPIEVACELGCAILSPLGAAHRAGIIHRDLKPDNVFLVRQSRGEMVKLLDFGISRATGLEGEFRLTTTGLVLGTPYYMSPEQARGDNVIAPQSDVYSLGVMLYEMLIGRVPISGDNYNQLMYRVMMSEYTPPRQLRPEIPEALEQLIVHAMASDPAHRPASAEEFERALLGFCRPTFRDNTIERISAQKMGGFSPVFTPAPMSKSGLGPPALGTAQTVAAGQVTQTRSNSRKGIIAIVALFLIAGGVTATVIATRSDELPVTPGTPTAPAAPPVAQNPPPTVAPPVAVPTTITLRFAITPPEAQVEIDGKHADADQVTVQKDDAKHHIHIVAAGYLPHDEDVRFDETQRLTIELEHVAAKPPKPDRGHPQPKKHPDKIESESPY